MRVRGRPGMQKRKLPATKKGQPLSRPPFTNVGCEELELKLQVQLEDATVNNRAGKVAIGAVRHGNRLEQLSKRTW